MKIDYIRFCVADAELLSDWFVTKLGFRAVAQGQWSGCQTAIIRAGAIHFVLCSPLTRSSDAARFLEHHPAGVSDVVFAVEDLDTAIAHAVSEGATLLQPVQIDQQAGGQVKWATLAAWGSLSHTLVQRQGKTTLLPLAERSFTADAALTTAPIDEVQPVTPEQPTTQFVGIDHVVLNVQKGNLRAAVRWYERVLQFQPQQKFEIQTQYSGLCSQVMRHPFSSVQLPINEPTSLNSQIQEFLTLNRGAGVQHIALETVDLIGTIAQLRAAGLPLIQVPSSYYTGLRDRPSLPLSEEMLQALKSQQILVDWQADPDAGVLLQTFTQPIFSQPTFFLELIERQTHPAARQPNPAQGFGEGNFQALFEAIEREQVKRGSLI